MTTAHTPGPWFASGTDVKPLGNRPLICWTGTPERALPEARANARLIAAAPRLLAALQHVKAIAKTGVLHQSSLSHDGLVELLAEAAQAAREAIAAAIEGE